MIKVIKKIISKRKDKKQEMEKIKERKTLIEKVEKGTDFAIRQYRDVFEKLAEYDRQ